MAQRKARFVWRVVSNAPCDDCLPRQGRVATLNQWAYWGLPGSGWSICRSYCKCELDPVDPTGLLKGTEPVSREPIKPRDLLGEHGYSPDLQGRDLVIALREIGRSSRAGAL